MDNQSLLDILSKCEAINNRLDRLLDSNAKIKALLDNVQAAIAVIADDVKSLVEVVTDAHAKATVLLDVVDSLGEVVADAKVEPAHTTIVETVAAKVEPASIIQIKGIATPPRSQTSAGLRPNMSLPDIEAALFPDDAIPIPVVAVGQGNCDAQALAMRREAVQLDEPKAIKKCRRQRKKHSSSSLGSKVAVL